jgi:phosphonate transport system permease protein
MSAPNAMERASVIRDLHRRRPRSRLVRWTAVGFTLLAVWAWSPRVHLLGLPFGSGEIATGELFSARRRANLERFLTEEALPAPLRESGFSWSGLFEWAGTILADHGWSAMLATLWISILAAVLAAAAATVLAPLAARTLATRDPYQLCGDDCRHGLGWRTLTSVTRLFLVALRAIPEYVWAFLLLAMLGPSAWPVVLALAIHNAGILGRLGADTIENLDAAPLRALRMVGASRRQLVSVAVLPLALPRLLLYFFYRFETCVREATVLGMLGVVSLGYWIQDARARHRYDEMLLLVALGAGIVIASDVLSTLARASARRGS